VSAGWGQELRFGVGISTLAGPGADPAAQARHAEALGFDLLTVSDHLHGTHPSLETWTVLTWIAAATSRAHVAPLVLGLPYRPPPVVAKMAESLQRLSDGRLVLGLGGGGADPEFAAFGLAARSPGEKVEALAEEIEILRGLWSSTPFSYEGKHFTLREAAVEPKPEAPIPIWTGSYGPRSLAVTGRLADGWNPSYPYAPPDVARGMRERVRAAAAEAGRDPDEITCAYNLSVNVAEGAPEHPKIVSGAPERVAERLVELCRMGFRTMNFWFREGAVAEQRERMANEVLPAVRAALA
jgi:alkanesulfonate monooxygenase SsuD/methylene tetrahydromethanopterin reductase-like flavin-dependent oxidoreductase (luciferase family)